MKKQNTTVELTNAVATFYEEINMDEVQAKYVKKKFLRKARAMQPVLLDPLNIQTGIAASLIAEIIEGSAGLTEKRKKTTSRGLALLSASFSASSDRSVSCAAFVS